MNERITVLSRLDDYHRVEECEHGFVCVYWHCTAWFFSPGDFLSLQSFLKACQQQPKKELVRDGYFILVRDGERRRLWYGESGLNLRPYEFRRLEQLVAEASEVMTLEVSDTLAHTRPRLEAGVN